MSIMPYIEVPQTSIDQITEFRGLNHNAVIGDNEFYDMLNMCVDNYPAITTRQKRLNGASVGPQHAVLPVTISDTQYVPFGKKYVSFPGKTLQPDGTSLEISEQTAGVIGVCDANGEAIILSSDFPSEYTTDDYGKHIGPTEPEDKTFPFWIDTSKKPARLKKYSPEIEDWNEITTYMVLSVSTLGTHPISEGDGVKLTIGGSPIDTATINIGSAEAPRIVPLFALDTPEQTDFCVYKLVNGNAIIPMNFCAFVACGGSVSGGDFAGGFVLTSGIKISRPVPDLDYVIECNNRLWGCRYGTQWGATGSAVNEIYASKLGDPFNWRYFNNTAMDSYTMSLGGRGDFTGAINYQSTPVFFKEDCVYRIYGNYPANYQLKTISGTGVAPGSHKSLVVMNDAVFYLGRDGVYRWTGGNPEKISEPLGPFDHRNGIGAVVGNKYYLSCTGPDNVQRMYVYNDVYHTWHIEDDNPNWSYFITTTGGVFANGYTKLPAEHTVSTNRGTLLTYENDFNFMLQTGNIGYMSPFRKYLNKINLKIKLPLTTKCYIEIKYDDEDSWHKICDVRPTGNTSSVTIPIVPRRCDYFALRIAGKGEMELVGIYKFYEEGSEYD